MNIVRLVEDVTLNGLRSIISDGKDLFDYDVFVCWEQGEDDFKDVLYIDSSGNNISYTLHLEEVQERITSNVQKIFKSKALDIFPEKGFCVLYENSFFIIRKKFDSKMFKCNHNYRQLTFQILKESYSHYPKDNPYIDDFHLDLKFWGYYSQES